MITPKLKILKTNDFLSIKPTGEVDFQKSKEFVQNLAESLLVPDHDLLIDAREAPHNLSITDLFEIVSILENHRTKFSNKIAIVPSPKTHNRQKADFFETAAANRGFNLRVFSSFGEAIDWLLSEINDLNDKKQS